MDETGQNGSSVCSTCSLGQYASVKNNNGMLLHWSAIYMCWYKLKIGECKTCPKGALCLTEGVLADKNYYLSVAHNGYLTPIYCQPGMSIALCLRSMS